LLVEADAENLAVLVHSDNAARGLELCIDEDSLARYVVRVQTDTRLEVMKPYFVMR